MKLDWSKKEIQLRYQLLLEKETRGLDKIIENLANTNSKSELKIKLSEALNAMSKCMINSVEKLAKENLNRSKRKKKKIGSMKFKKWWDSNMKELHFKVIESYTKYRLSNFSLPPFKRINILLRRDKRAKQLSDLFKLNKQSFWAKIKKYQKNSTQVDLDINDLKKHYEDHFTTRNKEETFQDALNERFVKEFEFKYKNKTFDHSINLEKFLIKLRNLKNGKSCGLNDVYYEMIKYANNANFYIYLKTIFEIITNKQMMPFIFNTSVIKPLIKNLKKSYSDLSNLRPVAISDCISNLFESIILDELNENYPDHKKQFGFKSRSSCQHAIWTLRQAINSNKRKGKWTYVCAIDASKAFDKINRTLLWKRLIEKKVNLQIILALINYYRESFLIVKNKDKFSMSFKPNVGVRQGGIASPKLFSIYLEDLLDKIVKNKNGVYLGKVKLDVIAYADDLLLISDTKKGMQELLKIVEEYGCDFEMKFNPEKTTFLIFNQKFTRTAKDRKEDIWQAQLVLQNEEITRVNSIKYLGVYINDDLNDKIHLENRKKAANVALAKLRNLEILTKRTNPYLKGHLFKTYLIPILHYGIETIKITKENLTTLERYENNILKNIYNIPKYSRSTNLRLINNLVDVRTSIKYTTIDFFERLIENNFTQTIIQELLTTENDDYINSIIEMLEEITYETNLNILNKCKYYKQNIKLDLKARKKKQSST
ncbi:unnamed protein product [Brachionus calyciflorus]|uniref:Reverse transcriptase domain-containing protein n=1 Tax=Brachionus calyciflorus TaxID=104777 RepID=A0A814CVE6_9BILA|nr:unnamed protein product [Brachionus calyciflorus]